MLSNDAKSPYCVAILQYNHFATYKLRILLASIADDPKPEQNVWYRSDSGEVVKAEQDESLVFNWLVASDINKVLVAGEYGVSRGGGLVGACAGRVALQLQEKGFDVARVEGSVFPTAPRDLHSPQVYDDISPADRLMVRALYEDTVSLKP